jgi:hypothetical protein
MSGETDVSGGLPLSAIVAVIAVETTGKPLLFLHILDDDVAGDGAVMKAVVAEQPRMMAITADSSTRRFNMVWGRRRRGRAMGIGGSSG